MDDRSIIRCYRCRATKPASEFNPSAVRLGGRCRPCEREHAAAWKRENLDKVKARNLARADRERGDQIHMARKREWTNRAKRLLKKQAFAILGDRCACCSEPEQDFLQIDHIANDGAEHRRRLGMDRRKQRGAPAVLYREIKNGRTHGLQLLCANCNWGKARNSGVCPHAGSARFSTSVSR